MASSYVEDYVFSLIPKIDAAAWSKAGEEIKQSLSKSKIAESITGKMGQARAYQSAQESVRSYEEFIKSEDWKKLSEAQQKKLTEEYTRNQALIGGTDKTTVLMSKLMDNKLTPIITQSIQALKLNNEITKLLTDVGEDLADKFEEFSETIVTSSSIFASGETKSTMAKFGIDAVSANALNNAFSRLGISASDLGTVTSGQRYGLTSLYSTYMEGMSNIDPTKLAALNENIQEYQLLREEFETKIQLKWMEFLANSDTLPQLVDSLGKSLDVLFELLDQGTPVIQFFLDTFVAFINAFIEVGNTFKNVFSGLLNGLGLKGSTTNNVTNISNTTNYGNTYNSSISSAFSTDSFQLSAGR